MKKLIVIAIAGVLIVVLSSAVEKVYKSTGPPSCHAGEPPNNATCMECHSDGTLNSGLAGVTLDLGGADTNYVAGKTYTITVTVFKPGMQRAGFQSIALRDDDNKTSPGKVTLTDAARTQVLDKNLSHPGGCLDEERVWIEHTYAGNSSNDSGISRWSYQWQAPATGAGSITFYLAALEANSDFAETGDQVYTLKKTIAGLPAALDEETDNGGFKVFPMPADEELLISYESRRPEQVILYTIAGQKRKAWRSFSSSQPNSLTLDVKDVDPGVYLLEIRSGRNIRAVKKVMIR